MALARAHGLLTQDGDGRGALEALVSTELAPYADARGRVTIGGPDVDLTPKAGMALAMAIHELATNAAKHGALSTESGRLSVTWEKAGPSEAPIVRISWRERDGPPVEPPTRRGFGASLIERALGYELDAVVTRTFDPAGMSCQIDLPLTDEMARLGEPRVEPESDR
jgi:two-component system CheB/CheR fusion protein